MPRFAKGSFEQLIYEQLQDEASDDGVSYVNPDGPVVHLEKSTGIFKGLSGVSFGDRMRAIKSMCRTHELGWVADEDAVKIIHNISNGE